MPAIEGPSTVAAPSTRSPADVVSNVAIGVFIVAALYFGREVFVPVALAILFSFVLAPLVKGLQKLRAQRAALDLEGAANASACTAKRRAGGARSQGQ